MNLSAKIPALIFAVATLLSLQAAEGDETAMDTFSFVDHTLNIHFHGHASLLFEFDSLHIYIDPVSRYADYASLPKADIILITHGHPDHLDMSAIDAVSSERTQIIANADKKGKLKNCRVLKNGESAEIRDISFKAVPAYNTSKGRKIFHPRGKGNGYLLTFPGKTVYIAGDTEDIPELAELPEIDIAFLPVNQPYTMTVEQAARAATIISPRVLYPYHYSKTDISKLKDILEKDTEIDVRIRELR